MKKLLTKQGFTNLVMAALLSLLSCCASYTREIKTDERFQKILTVEIISTDEMRLYHIALGSERSSAGTAYKLTEKTILNDPDYRLIGTISPGQKVVFERAYAKAISGGIWEWLVGESTYKGKTYKIEYSLGFKGAGGFNGWRRVYESFELGPAPKE